MDFVHGCFDAKEFRGLAGCVPIQIIIFFIYQKKIWICHGFCARVCIYFQKKFGYLDKMCYICILNFLTIKQKDIEMKSSLNEKIEKIEQLLAEIKSEISTMTDMNTQYKDALTEAEMVLIPLVNNFDFERTPQNDFEILNLVKTIKDGRDYFTTWLDCHGERHKLHFVKNCVLRETMLERLHNDMYIRDIASHILCRFSPIMPLEMVDTLKRQTKDNDIFYALYADSLEDIVDYMISNDYTSQVFCNEFAVEDVEYAVDVNLLGHKFNIYRTK